MTQVITGKYHYNDDEDPEFYDRPLTIRQKQLENGDWVLWDTKNNCEVPWDKVAGICASIDNYILTLTK